MMTVGVTRLVEQHKDLVDDYEVMLAGEDYEYTGEPWCGFSLNVREDLLDEVLCTWDNGHPSAYYPIEWELELDDRPNLSSSEPRARVILRSEAIRQGIEKHFWMLRACSILSGMEKLWMAVLRKSMAGTLSPVQVARYAKKGLVLARSWDTCDPKTPEFLSEKAKPSPIRMAKLQFRVKE